MSRCIKRSSSRRISGTIRRERERKREREQQQQHHQNGFPFCFVGVPPPVFPARQAYRSFGRSSRRIFLCPSTHCFKSRICLFFDGRESLTSSGKPDVTPRRDFRDFRVLSIFKHSPRLRDSSTVSDTFFFRYRCYPRLEKFIFVHSETNNPKRLVFLEIFANFSSLSLSMLSMFRKR